MDQLEKVLIANRGEIAVRVIRTCRELGIASAVLCSEADTGALHARMADEVVAITGRSAVDSYLRIEAITDAIAQTGADAVHPGYGFLSESAAAATAVEAAGAIWIGPPPAAIAAMGDKLAARAVAARAGVAVVPGTDVAVRDAADVIAFAADVGYPVAVKASFGGGGRGMKVIRSDHEAGTLLDLARRESAAAFGSDECYLERYLDWPRHVEVQVLADDHGNVVAIGDRDCSVQRRHQKLVEEAPAPLLADDVRDAMHRAAEQLCREVGYRSAGTVELLYQDGRFWFLEMNARLQVEHPVTELVTGLDLVAEQLRVAGGHPLSFGATAPTTRGHAIEVRINAEDPAGGRFVPSPGRITGLRLPSGPGVRWDGGYEAGDDVSPFYDNLIGKLITWAPDREAAINRMTRALGEMRVDGVATTISAERTIIAHEDFADVRHATRWLEARLSFERETSAAVANHDVPNQEEAVESSAGRREVEVGGRMYHVPFLAPFLAPFLESTSQDSKRAARSGPPPLGAARTMRPAVVATGRAVSPMQGTVLTVLVAAGDPVSTGQTLVVLEAMKMENPVKADRDGVVSEVLVRAGSLVAAGELLVLVA